VSRAAQLSTSDALRGVRAGREVHAFEPSFDPRRAGCFKQLRTAAHRWYCGELSTHPIHQVNEARS
jgi:hypothetical protein